MTTLAAPEHRLVHRQILGPDGWSRRLGLLELLTGVVAVAGGTLLMVEPDGSLLSADLRT